MSSISSAWAYVNAVATAFSILRLHFSWFFPLWLQAPSTCHCKTFTSPGLARCVFFYAEPMTQNMENSETSANNYDFVVIICLCLTSVQFESVVYNCPQFCLSAKLFLDSNAINRNFLVLLMFGCQQEFILFLLLTARKLVTTWFPFSNKISMMRVLFL